MRPNWTLSLLVLAACAGWTLAVAFEDVSRPYLASVGAGTVLVGTGFRKVDASRVKWLAGGEGIAVFAVPVGFFAAWSMAGALDESSLLAGLFAAFVFWLVAAITITDMEAVTEPTDLVEGVSGALGRITTRLVLVGMALMIAIVVGHGGFPPVTTPRPIQSGVVGPFVLYWLVGLGGVASLNRSRLLARWKRDRSEIDPDLGPRWRAATLLSLIAATILAVSWFLAARPMLDLGHRIVATGLGGATTLIRRLLGLELPAATASGGAQTEVPAAPESAVNPITPPPEWLDLFLLVAAGSLFAFAFVVFRRRAGARGTSGPRVLWSVLRSLLATLGGILRELFLGLRSMFRRRRATARIHDRSRRGGGPAPPGWSPGDPWRRQIANEYRAFLNLARTRVGPLRAGETPSELARRIEGPDAGESPVGVLTEIFELARFSDHLLDELIVRRAREARMEIAGDWEEPG